MRQPVQVSISWDTHMGQGYKKRCCNCRTLLWS